MRSISGGGTALIDRSQDGFHDTVQIVHDVRIPESQNAITFLFYRPVAFSVMCQILA
jgi:hypothetical protein